MRKAVVIGINDYPKAPLSACINDAESVIELLNKHGDGSPNFDARIHRDVQTKVELTDMIYKLFNAQNDIALLYFSGHGFRDELDTFLVTPDAEEYDLGLSFTSLIKMANESKSRNRIIILDCCYSGSAGTTNVLGDSLSLLEKGVTILTASRHNETAKELVNNHGIFTNLLLQALGGGAADISGNITSGSLYAYIDQALGAHDQRPVFKTNITEFIPLRTIVPQVSRDILRRISEYFPRPDYYFPLNPSYEETNSVQTLQTVIQPTAEAERVAVFKDLQKYHSVGLLIPVDTPHMYNAAMNTTGCRLTPLGMHYWRLAKRNKI